MAIIEQSLPDNELDRARIAMLCPTHPMSDSPVIARNNRLVIEWLKWMQDTAHREPNTVYNYASVVAKYLDLCVLDRPLDAVPVEDIEAWLLRPREGRAKGRVGSPATRARNIAVLASFYKWLQARGHITHNVTDLLVAPKVHNRKPRPIDDLTWMGVWGDAHNTVRSTAMLGLGFYCGLRRAEIAALRPEHLDRARRRLVGFVRKGGGDDVFPVGEVLEVWHDLSPRLLGDYNPDTLWGALSGPVGASQEGLGYPSPDAINQDLRRLLERHGRPGAFTPHALRHSFVTNLLRVGMPLEMVSDLANHSNVTVTMRYAKGGGGRVAEWRQNQSSPTRVPLSDWR